MGTSKLRNCNRCGKVFLAVSGPTCRECIEDMNRDFQRVREYIREHKAATVLEVTQETGVPADQIYEWIRQGRLEMDAKVSGVDLTCTFCGRKIDKGRICPSCVKQWGGTVQEEAKTERTPSKSQVHIMERINRKER